MTTLPAGHVATDTPMAQLTVPEAHIVTLGPATWTTFAPEKLTLAGRAPRCARWAATSFSSLTPSARRTACSRATLSCDADDDPDPQEARPRPSDASASATVPRATRFP